MSVRDETAPILPGATIGILGGGQLGRMTAMAARSMGYDVHVLDPDPDCSAKPVASRVVTARFDDVSAAVDLAKGCDVVTLEIEQIAPTVMEAVAQRRSGSSRTACGRRTGSRSTRFRWASSATRRARTTCGPR